MSEFFGINGDGGVERFIYNHADDVGMVQTSYDLTPILDMNKARQNDGTNGWTASRDMKHQAFIPNALIEKWFIEEGINAYDKSHWPAIRRKLNDPDYAFLRTSSGKL
jgi:hypothetical protein